MQYLPSRCVSFLFSNVQFAPGFSTYSPNLSFIYFFLTSLNLPISQLLDYLSRYLCIFPKSETFCSRVGIIPTSRFCF